MWPELKRSAVVTISVGAYFDKNFLKFLTGVVDQDKFNAYADEVCGARIERQFVITESGAEELAPSPSNC